MGGISVIIFPVLEAGVLILCAWLIFLIFRRTFPPAYLAVYELARKYYTPLVFGVFIVIVGIGVWAMLHWPYLWIFNAGDAKEITQVFYTAGHGKLFEQSYVYFMNGYWKSQSLYYYGSSLILNIWITPLLLFSWLYAFHPYPPTQTMIVHVFVYVFGGLSLFYIARKITSNLYIAGYLLLLFVSYPFMFRIVFYKGAFDVYAIPLLLWMLYFLYRNRFAGFVVFAMLAFGVSMVSQFTCISMTIAGFMLYRQKRYLVFAGAMLLMNLGSFYVMDLVRFCLTTDDISAVAGLTTRTLTRHYHSAGSLIRAMVIEGVSVGLFVLFLSPYLVRFIAKNRFSLLLFAACIPSLIITAIRGANMDSHHHADIFATLFFIMVLFLNGNFKEYTTSRMLGKFGVFQLLAFIIVPFVVFANTNMGKKILHLPHDSGYANRTEKVDRNIPPLLGAMEQMVPRNASLCYWVDQRFEAQFASRPSVWRMYVDEKAFYDYPSCQFYLVQKELEFAQGAPPDPMTAKIIEHPGEMGLIPVYENDVFKVLKNPKPDRLLYPEWVMGFNFLANIGKKECPPSQKTILPGL